MGISLSVSSALFASMTDLQQFLAEWLRGGAMQSLLDVMYNLLAIARHADTPAMSPAAVQLPPPAAAAAAVAA